MKPDRISRFIEELKRRRVFRGIVVYGASTLLIYEAATNLCNTFGMDAAPPWIVWVLGVGFFGSLWFSWIYDITPGGIVRTDAESTEKVPIPKKQVITYKTTTFISFLIIIVLLSYRIVEGRTIKKISQLDKTIAVLPYQEESSHEQRYDVFEVIGNLITSKLINVRDYRVVPWEDVRNYSVRNKSTSEIGEDLSAAILVIWEPLRTLQEEFLFVRLISSNEEEMLWSDHYEITENWSADEIDKYCRKISASIARKLRTYPTREEKAAIREIPKSPKATMYASLGKAIALDSWDRYQTDQTYPDTLRRSYIDSADFAKAIEFFTEAIKEDSTFALAYALRAKTWLWGYRGNIFHKEILEVSQSDIWRALELNEYLPEAHIAQGLYYYFGLLEHQMAYNEFFKAMELAPTNTECLFYMAKISASLGHWENAQNLSERLMTVRPLKSIYLTNLGIIFLHLHDFEKSLVCHSRSIRLTPAWYAPYINKSDTYLAMGDLEEARRTVLDASYHTGRMYHRFMALLDLYGGNYQGAIVNIEKSSVEEYEGYGETEGALFLEKAKIYSYAGYPEKANIHYQYAVDYFGNLVKSNPKDAMALSQLGVALAGIGNYQLALSNGKMGLALIPLQRDAILEPFIKYNMVSIYTMTGDIEAALHSADELTQTYSYFTSDFLKLDPTLKKLF